MKELIYLLLVLYLLCGCAPQEPEPTQLTQATVTDETEGVNQVYQETVPPALLQLRDELEEKLLSLMDVVPNVVYLPDYDPVSSTTGENRWSHIRALTFDGANIGENKTKVFAYIGYPENAENAPAVVLVHGGLGHPYAMWIKEWTDRGYVAIAFENTGYFPTQLGKNVAGRDSDPQEYWEYGLAGNFAEEGYVNAPTNSGMTDSGAEADTQWMYHCVAQTILAHNILRNDPAVDPERIGITGISWGGVISSVAIGFDTRYAFAIPVYCSAGYSSQTLGNMGSYFGNLPAKTVWGAENRFDNVDFPVLWLCWNDDSSSSIHAPSFSYLHTKNGNERTTFSIINNMQHYHSAAWNQKVNYRFADWVVQNGTGLTTLDSEPSGRSFKVSFTAPADAVDVSAKVYYITEEMTYSKQEGQGSPVMDQTWKTYDCFVKGNTVSCTLPPDAHSYYLELTTLYSDAGCHVTTSSFITP